MTTATKTEHTNTATIAPAAKAKKIKVKKSTLPKKVGYFILNVPDMTKAIAFYKSIGLKTGYESAEWTEFKAGIKFALHGMCANSASACAAGASKRTGIVFAVKNAQKSYETFKALGIKVLSAPVSVCEDGRSFDFEDPFGNILSAYGK